MASIRETFDYDKLEKVLALRPSMKDTCSIFRLSKETLADIIRKKYDKTFQELRDEKVGNTRVALVQKAIKMVLEDGNTAMTIFMLKNWCGYKDRHEVDVQVRPTMTINRPNGERVVMDVGDGSQKND